MITRRNLLLSVCLLLLLGLELLQRTSLGGSQFGRALFPGFDAGEVIGIELTSGDQSVHLDFKAGLWVVRERADFHAEKYLVESLLRRLPDLSDKDKVASEASSHRIYGLGQERIHVQLSSASNPKLIGFSVGRPKSESQGSYILLDQQASVYRAAALDLPQMDPAMWLNLHLIAGFDMTQVRSIQVGFQDARRLNLERLENGRWNAIGMGKTIAPSQVQQLMAFAINAVMRDVSDLDQRAAGLELPALTLNFFLEGGVRRLDLGASLGEGRAASSPDWGAEWVVEVPNSVAESLEGTAELIYANLLRE